MQRSLLTRLYLQTATTILAVMLTPVHAQSSSSIFVYAAGSLRAPLSSLARSYEQAQPDVKITLVFGASGLLKDRIASQTDTHDQAAHVFASANMEHPQALATTGRFAATRRFTRNNLCVLTAMPGLTAALNGELSDDQLVGLLLNPAVKVGTSTPLADPSGDYTWQLFDKIEASEAGPAGSASALKAKALQLTGGPNSPPPPADRNVYGVLTSAGKADVFITYCTNAIIARSEVPSLRVLSISARLNVSADYGMTVALSAPLAAKSFADFLVSAQAQKVLQSAGFSPLP
jgi:molybdate transport system substrate-binding protein